MSELTNMNINELRQKLQHHYRSLTKRQRVVLFFVVAVLIFMLGNIILVSPMKKRAANAQTKLLQLKTSVNEVQTKTDLLMAEVQGSLANPGSAKSQSLSSQMQDLDAELVGYYEHLIPASKMGEILQQALVGETGLELVGIRSLKAEKMTSYESAEGDESAALYRKGIEMVFSGDYFSTIDYLKKLEGLEWHLLWGSFKYKVIDYPTAEVTIEVHTLSSEEGWIGG